FIAIKQVDGAGFGVELFEHAAQGLFQNGFAVVAAIQQRVDLVEQGVHGLMGGKLYRRGRRETRRSAEKKLLCESLRLSASSAVKYLSGRRFIRGSFSLFIIDLNGSG